jgi:aspartate/methionine/tyrosine aminotransferase
MERIITDIGDIEKYTNPETFFISGWDKDPATMNFFTSIIPDAVNCYKNKQNSYYFMSGNEELKEHFLDKIINPHHINISTNNISIAPNGTSGIFLCILLIKNVFKVSNVLLISPTYFTNINVIRMLDMKLYHYQIDIVGNEIINFNELKKKVSDNNIELIIITDPIFGAGISISKQDYVNILNLAKDFGIWVIIDYIYGGMEWDQPTTIINKYILKLIVDYPRIFIIESISKRLFLNGIKFAIIYSNSGLIDVIEETSESFIGSSSYVQHELFKRIYEPSNIPTIINHIEKNIEYIKLTYNSIRSALLGKNVFLSDCTSGYFALMGIPIQQLNNLSNNEATFAIIDKVNIFTIPHSRYLFECKDYYYFRINLSLDRALLIKNINKLLDAYFY